MRGILSELLESADYQLEGASTRKERGEVDDFMERHGPGISFLHRLAATEDYLEAKAHALLGIGAESSGALYSILRQRLGEHVGSMPVRASSPSLQRFLVFSLSLSLRICICIVVSSCHNGLSEPASASRILNSSNRIAPTLVLT